MSPLITLQKLSQSYGTQHLFSDISCSIKDGERIGLIGMNGCGKSTLLKILVGEEVAKSGHIAKRQGLKIGYASQAPLFPDLCIEDILLEGVPSNVLHEAQIKARILLSKAQFSDIQSPALSLSGGWKKRLDIIRALMFDPDLVLLDEPTNHLDIEGIEWLEKLLRQEKRAFVIVSHDRYFLEHTCTRIIELNRCYPQGLFSFEGSLSQFVEAKFTFLEGQKEQEARLSSKLRTELEWLKKSPKARTKKSQARVSQAHEMIEQLSQLKARNTTTKLDLSFSESDRESRKLVVVKNLSKSFGTVPLFQNLDLVISPGMRLGIVGKNGTGKSTLLKILAGKLPQDTGTRKCIDGLRIIYFDQHRQEIPSDLTLKEALSPHGEFVEKNGVPIHVNGWAKRFLFSPERLLLPVRYLSGGERARIHIAKLMLEQADILFLDEPTNDLDIETLQVMEEELEKFEGAVVLISHDRCLMDNICTHIIGLGGDGKEYLFADYTQWESYLKKCTKKETEVSVSREVEKSSPSKKLSYKEKKELNEMQQNIEQAEHQLCTLTQKMEQQEVGFNPRELFAQIAKAQAHVDTLYARWQELLSLCPEK